MIPVTRPYLPDLSSYTKYIEEIYERNYLTNQGPLVLQLEDKLKKHLAVKNITILGNGTVALQIAIKSLKLNKKYILTTPFSFIATVSSIVWENFIPVFVDIDEDSFNVDVTKIKESITDDIGAMLFTHVFGNPCDVEGIAKISKEFSIPVIYDAAHCFGVKLNETSIFNFGTISTCSFHATKLFHTVEGGCVVSNHNDISQSMRKMSNFGHDGPTNFSEVGINGKMSEIHAAMGHCVLQDIKIIKKRREEQYKMYLSHLDNTKLKYQKLLENIDYNYSYFPVVFQSENILLSVIEVLGKNDIHPRRYFYPSLNKVFFVEDVTMEVVESIASRILCLPIYYTLEKSEIISICKLINDII